jgi:hypothetical protein
MKDGTFPISIYIAAGEHQTYFVEHIPVSSREEHFFVTRAGETIVLGSNRPLFRRKGLKHRRGDYQVLSKQVHNIGLVNRLIEAIETKQDLWDRDTLPPAQG